MKTNNRAVIRQTVNGSLKLTHSFETDTEALDALLNSAVGLIVTMAKSSEVAPQALETVVTNQFKAVVHEKLVNL